MTAEINVENEHNRKVDKKHKIILWNLKKYSKENDDIWDKQLIDEQITTYFFFSKNKIKKDKSRGWSHRHIVKTKMFWWSAKHLNSLILRDLKNNS